MSAPKRYVFVIEDGNLRRLDARKNINKDNDYLYWIRVASGAGVETIFLSTTPIWQTIKPLLSTSKRLTKVGSCVRIATEHTIQDVSSAPSVRNDTLSTTPATNVCHKRGKTRLSRGRLE